MIGIQGDVEQSTVSYIIRDHDRAKFENRKKEIERLVAQMNAEYGLVLRHSDCAIVL